MKAPRTDDISTNPAKVDFGSDDSLAIVSDLYSIRHAEIIVFSASSSERLRGLGQFSMLVFQCPERFASSLTVHVQHEHFSARCNPEVASWI
jgi:hypothetical protein